MPETKRTANATEIEVLWISFLIQTAFVIWVIFYGGAEELEGKIASAFLISPLAPMLTAPLIKLYVFFTWVMSLVFHAATLF